MNKKTKKILKDMTKVLEKMNEVMISIDEKMTEHNKFHQEKSGVKENSVTIEKKEMDLVEKN